MRILLIVALEHREIIFKGTFENLDWLFPHEHFAFLRTAIVLFYQILERGAYITFV